MLRNTTKQGKHERNDNANENENINEKDNINEQGKTNEREYKLTQKTKLTRGPSERPLKHSKNRKLWCIPSLDTHSINKQTLDKLVKETARQTNIYSTNRPYNCNYSRNRKLWCIPSLQLGRHPLDQQTETRQTGERNSETNKHLQYEPTL
eukprot:Awhi_evm1s13755